MPSIRRTTDGYPFDRGRNAAEGGGLHARKSDGRLLVYRSQYAGTNKATSVTWSVGNAVDDLVRLLKTKGVSFERYEFPEVKHEGDVHVMGDMRAACFKDPDGNIHSLVSD